MGCSTPTNSPTNTKSQENQISNEEAPCSAINIKSYPNPEEEKGDNPTICVNSKPHMNDNENSDMYNYSKLPRVKESDKSKEDEFNERWDAMDREMKERYELLNNFGKDNNFDFSLINEVKRFDNKQIKINNDNETKNETESGQKNKLTKKKAK